MLLEPRLVFYRALLESMVARGVIMPYDEDEIVEFREKHHVTGPVACVWLCVCVVVCVRL